MSLTAEQLFALLPAVYRTRDAAGGGQLQTLFTVMAAQSAIVEDNINQLYDDQFIETCAPWVIPYIGDLLGYNSIYEITAASSDSRAEIANTIGYRRRKGTLLALEQLAMDVSGRHAFVVEQFRRLITTQSLRHVEPGRDATVSLRRGRALGLIGTPFDVANRTIDVRRIAPRARPAADPDPTPLDIALHGPGQTNIPDVAIHLWRWQSWQVTAAPATAAGRAADGRYRFSPLGNDMPLFSQPAARAVFSGVTTRADIPLPIGRGELEQFYGAPPDGSILLTADGIDVDAGQVYGANLADRPGGSWCTVAPGKIAIDPELGRIQYAADVTPPTSLRLTYFYGAAAAIGGPAPPAAVPTGHFSATVGSSAYPTLDSAVAGWNRLPPKAGSTGVIILSGFESLTANHLTGTGAVQLPAGSSLAIEAIEADSDSLVTISGDIEVACLAGPPNASGQPMPAGQLLISGARIAGQLHVTGTGASAIQIADSTFVPGLGLLPNGEPLSPGEPSIVVTAEAVNLSLNRVISGPVAADLSGSTRICASIIDATSPYYVAYAGPNLALAGGDLHVEDSTIVGKVHTRTLTLASNTIFHARLGRSDPWAAAGGAAIWASRRQSGCVRFCVLPFNSITPRRYRCLPPDTASEPALEPRFITLRYGLPAYAMLSGDVPMAIWTGADNGSQMGAYLQAQETEAVSNVALRALEYLPALQESGIFIHPSRPPAEIPVEPTPYGYVSPRHHDLPAQLPGIGAGLI
jgi:hypothetical protein